MRTELRARVGEHCIYRGTFKRFGRRLLSDGSEMLTVLLVRICDGRGNLITDHLWFKEYKPFMVSGMQPGDRVQFVAQAQPYNKPGNVIDYRLVDVSGVHVVTWR